MSDRTRSSVRTDSREETGTPDAGTPPETSSGSSGATGAGHERPGFDDTARTAAARPEAAESSTRSGRGAAATPPPVDATQAVTLPPAGATPPRTTRPADATRSAEPAADGAAGSAPAKAGASGKGRNAGPGRGPRRARLQLRHIDTWSALKISLVVSIALFFVWMVAVAILYGVLGNLDVFDTLNEVFAQLRTDDGGGGDVITAGIVFWGAAIIGAVNIVLLTALCTVAAFVYNLCSDLVGGLEVTLAERD
ncbi:DUF3566 domain-containing protein [Modestobacter roseus]|uniref:Transmembrane protein DUF3566 n=1 Tax=Modestobacter roseus TaxID=1181884 RepID=A0A562IVC9_9ACTN|nr:DUF3566 domain-containing protein [Modestobacter roseus]MQA33431.1 DUF3566 domain-containing protein [Modestobacter roseus]TWH74981.1 transmembrane protein DUF3566 [Modestobacter roseus]